MRKYKTNTYNKPDCLLNPFLLLVNVLEQPSVLIVVNIYDFFY